LDISWVTEQFEKAGLQARSAQLEMMQVIELAIKNKSIAVIEGGTGIGKTLGYLIPALLTAKPDQKIVIATATVNLQMQLINKDLPLVSQLLGRPIRAEIAKGRRRYVCLSRLFSSASGDEASGDQAQLDLLGLEAEEFNKNNTKNSNKNSIKNNKLDDLTQRKSTLDQLIEALEQDWTGDRDLFEEPLSDELWQQVSTDAGGCSGRRCAYIRECPFFKARGRLKSADIIVANHDVLLSDLVMGSGVLLPESSETIYLIDEAHHFPVKALEHFASTTSVMGAKNWLAKMSLMSRRLKVVLPDLRESIQSFDELYLRMQETLGNLYIALEPLMTTHAQKKFSPKEKDLGASGGSGANFNASFNSGVEWIISGENSGENFGAEQIEPFLPLIQRLIADAHPLQNLLYLFRKNLAESHSDKTLPDFDPILQALGFLIQKNHTLIRTWELFSAQESVDISPIAKWISIKKQRGGLSGEGENLDFSDFYIHGAYTSASRILPQFFWNQKTQGIILCSATLRSLGNFDSYLVRAGLDNLENKSEISAENLKKVNCHAFLSPFDYGKSELHIPPMKFSPVYEKNAEYLEEVVSKIMPILECESHGTLVLFTSKSMMENAYEQLPEHLKNLVLLQGIENKSQLLQRHKDRIDAGIPSAIFGLQSFAEGVDLPGDYCRHVVITKLPFSVPSTPIEQTFLHWLKLRQEDPFLKHTLPEASLRLNQFAGRLIRHENDSGKLTILDRRIIDKRYGKALIKALPAFKFMDSKMLAKAEK
jgi:ATP-dependent DNA helicase DinG